MIDAVPSRGFDVTQAAYPVRVVPLGRVVDLLPISHAPERVGEFRRLMAAGHRFPPIAVIRVARRWLVADGHKRLTAYAGLGEPRIAVQVWTYRRWLRDQWDQAAAHASKNRRMFALASSDRPEARRLLLTTVLHWRRAAVSLIRLGTGRL